MENPKFNTQQLMVSTLTQIGCQPAVNEDGTVAVTYQGEHFHIDFGGVYAKPKVRACERPMGKVYWIPASIWKSRTVISAL